MDTNDKQYLYKTPRENEALTTENIDLKARIVALEKENTLLSLIGNTHLPYLQKEGLHAFT